MRKNEALTLSIGVLAVVDTYVTATVFPVPVCAVFGIASEALGDLLSHKSEPQLN
jgi:hypothetical protein